MASIQPKTWSKNEVIELIAESITKTRDDCRMRGVPASPATLAESIYADMNDNYLIELQP